MCGILLVHSQSHMPLQRHEPALEILRRRGPDLVKYQWVSESTFVAQTVLHITGTNDFYYQNRPDAFAYNGEIYDYQNHGQFNNDVELAYHTVRTNPSRFAQFQGTWAWAWSDGNDILWASDPQGEKSLYYYQDPDIMVVSSDIAAVLTYVRGQSQTIAYANKGWSMISCTPWQGIQRCEPGRLYRNGMPQHYIDSLWQWIGHTYDYDQQDVAEAFDCLWKQTIKLIRPSESACLSFSGGLDSSLIAHSMPELTRLTVDCVGKDSIVAALSNCKITVDALDWAKHYRDLIIATKMPAQSWSHVGKWLVAKHSPDRIVFTGLGADELFGGYAHHGQLGLHHTHIHSPYCEHDHDYLWDTCLCAYNGDARQAILLMDYWYQVVGVDAPGLDRLGGYWGKETRNPFLMPMIIKFALNLNWQTKLGSQGKWPLRAQYEKTTGQTFALPKKGFAGHANDSLPWMNLDIGSSSDRHSDWQRIATHSFYHWMDGK